MTLLLRTYYCCEKAVGTGKLVCQECAEHPYPPEYFPDDAEVMEALDIQAGDKQ